MIEVRGLTKHFGGLAVLNGLDASIGQGEVISVIGPSGTGKSTFLRCLNLLEQPDGGQILIGGDDILRKGANVPALRRRMGMVFQNFNLFSHLMIIENVMLGPTALLDSGRQAAYDEGMALLARVGIADKALNYPDELSGGQKQRAAIARTLAMKPDIVLFDEPTSALDPTMVSEVLAVIRNLAGEGLTMMIVTHEMEFARNVSSRVFYMDEGVVYEEGPPEKIYDDPDRPKTRAFIYKIRTFNYSIESRSFDLYEMSAQIEQFALKQLMGDGLLRRLQLICEEMLVNLLLPALPKEDLDVRVTIDYTERSEETELVFSWQGDDVRPLEDGDDLSVLLVKRYASGIETGKAEGRHFVRMRL